jgi:hypothetical protein
MEKNVSRIIKPCGMYHEPAFLRTFHETSLHCGWLFFIFSTVRRVGVYRIIVEEGYINQRLR